MARRAAYRLYVWLMVFSGLVLALTLGATSVKIILAGRHFTQTILEENKGFLANSLRFTHEAMMRTEKEARAGENTLIPIRVNMGIQSGQVYLGSTKMRAREGERWTYTASGEATIVAARLADHATGGRILLGQETARRIDGSLPLAAMGKVQLKNLACPEEVHEALPGAERSSPTATGFFP